MKKQVLLFLIAIPQLLIAGGPIASNAIVPKHIEGNSPTNNNRVPFYFWGEVSGLTPNATYHFYCAMDTANPSTSSNGAGLPYLINPVSTVIRRVLNPSMTANTGYDSLVADNTGQLKGWFGVEPTGSARFTPGTILFPKIMLNNGAGGTSVASRINFDLNPVTVLSFGTTAMSPTQGSAIFDSLNATPKNFICIYDNTTATGRPISIAIVENDGLMIKHFGTTAMFYKTQVDSLNFHWGTIIPNNLPNGIRALEERSFLTGSPIDTAIDADGIWCYGTNTVNMTNGSQNALYLNTTFVLSSSVVYQDSTYTGILNAYAVSSNSPNATYAWDYGDSNIGTGANTSHAYNSAGTYILQIIISTGGCSDTISQTIVVESSAGIFTPSPLVFQLIPNPTNGEIFITTKHQGNKNVCLNNLLGQVVFSQVISGTKININLSGQAPGIYILTLTDIETGKTGVQKIILE